MRILVTAKKLQENIQKLHDKLVFIDVRQQGEKLANTVQLDLRTDLTGEDSFMPNIGQLANKLGKQGISNDNIIIIFDDGSNRAAAKAWVVFHYIGHEAVYILQGGSEALQSIAVPKFEGSEATYDVNKRKELLVNIEHVKRTLKNDDVALIDSRSSERYAGKVEPKYKRAGHIPGAKNYHSQAVFAQDGTYKRREDIQKHFAELYDKKEVIASCGSGTSACMNVVALKEAGFKNVKLYPGGFSEWISDDENEVAQK